MIAAVTTHQNLTVTLHQGFSRVFLIYSLLLGLWGLFLWARGLNPSGSFLGALVLDEAVATLQDLIGIVLVVQGHRADDPLHYLYGVIAVLTLPVAYTYSSRGTIRRDSLIFGLATLFLFGISIRAALTG